ncbi:MAG TPA: MarR family transcriptional regulator [Acidobacteriaceae bacterium]|jgi:DNA-binding MarR family transcriptional regulator
MVQNRLPMTPVAACPEEALFVELVRTADRLSREPTQLLREHDLSPAPYNVLRILRGAPEGLLCGEIAARMINREPDITRLVDRLEKRDLVHRGREDRDRRRVLVRITPAGLALLSRLDLPIQELHRRQLGHLTSKELKALGDLLAATRRNPA